MSKKEELWKHLQDEFVVPQSYKEKCFKSMSDMFRKYKCKLRMKYLDPHSNLDSKLNNRPPRVRPEDWEMFIQHNSDPRIVEQRKKNAENRKNLKIYHMSGRHGHARIEEEMQRQKKDGDTLISRTEVWIKTHTRKDGSIHSNAASHVEKVKELLASEGSNSHDILNDPLTQVFGPNTRGRVRGVGTTVSQSQIRGSAAALEKISSYKGKVEEQSSTIQEQSFKIQELSSKIDFLTDEIGGIKEMMQQHMDLVQPENRQSTGGPSVGNHQCVERMRPCKLYSWRKELVAQGFVTNVLMASIITARYLYRRDLLLASEFNIMHRQSLKVEFMCLEEENLGMISSILSSSWVGYLIQLIITIQKVCSKIDSYPNETDVLERIFAGVSIYYNYTGDVKCFDLGDDPHGMSGWDWQACTEMVMPMSSSKENSMFPTYEFDYPSYQEQCLQSYGVKPRPRWITTEFGGHDLKTVLKKFGSNIIFSNGLLDPWSGGSVLQNVSESIVALVTKEGAHHIDLRAATNEDPDWLVAQRKAEIDLIKGWLYEYYKEKKAAVFAM